MTGWKRKLPPPLARQEVPEDTVPLSLLAVGATTAPNAAAPR